MKKEFALEHGGPKRLTVTYPASLANAEVLFDGQRIMAFSSKPDFLRGTTCKLPDGSMLTVRFGAVAGFPIFKGVHAVRNGLPIPNSAADPAPKWAWIFIVGCVLIPVVTLGGFFPAFIGFGGAAGTLTVSRLNRWSVALRAGVCALITLASWSALLLLGTAVVAVKAVNQGKQPLSSFAPAPSSPDKLIHDIQVTYYKHGYMQSDIDKIKDNLEDHCDEMQPAQCVDYLRKALQEAKNSPNIE
jgi:hypothetical protein